ncbi:uncharacterized protein LOC117639739 [Thrips palmi]|uniref:Uncharacterized protein LOC117639739 n=1 Tax=Thrips palmi TaxID=161013 RepID=A0A6P8Y690_THRPL|nr:uncharacterized protein LOC117639739 [Thrips palmi]
MDEDENSKLSRRAAQLLRPDSDENLGNVEEEMECDLSLGFGDEPVMSLEDAEFMNTSPQASLSTAKSVRKHELPSPSPVNPRPCKAPCLDLHAEQQTTETVKAPSQNVDAEIDLSVETLSENVDAEIDLSVETLSENVEAEIPTLHDNEQCTLPLQPQIPEAQVLQDLASHNISDFNLEDLSKIPDQPLDLVPGSPEITEPLMSSESHSSDKLFGPAYFWNYTDDDNAGHLKPGQPHSSVLEDSDQGTDTDEEEEEEEETVQDTSTNQGNESLIYPEAPISVWESVTAMLTFVQRHNISGVGFGDLLSLVDLHLPKPNSFVKTRHAMFKLLEDIKEPVNIHYFCSLCYKTCKSLNDLCNVCTDENRKVEHFITFSLEAQVRRLFKRPDFVENLKQNRIRVKQNENNIEDIWDGEAYKLAESLGRTGKGLTVMWNTDGVPIYKSVSYSLWPVYLVSLELPPEKRFLSENLIIAGIWCSASKPHPNVYLVPILKELLNLKNGIDVEYFGKDEKQRITCSVLCGTCDAPATASFLNMKSHSGFFSCHLCLIRGAYHESTVFPYEENVPLRNMADYDRHVKQAVKDKIIFQKSVKNEEQYCGIKGPTVLSHIMDDIFSSMAIDSMHALYLGIMRQMMRIWFIDGKYQDKAQLLTQKLLEQAPPDYLQRRPQPVEKLVHWKATEYRSFLFNLSVVLLKDILDPEDYEHYCLFVKGTSLLNTNSISPEDMKESDKLLNQFSKEFESLYSVNDMSHNLHMSLHLCKCVMYLGPLWAISCFKFEDINGRILNLVHGTRYAGLQIRSHIGVITHLPLMINNLREGPVKAYCKKRRHRLRISDVMSPGTFVVGLFSAVTDDFAWVVGMLNKEKCINERSRIMLFHRFQKNSLLYVATSYKRSTRVSSFVTYNSSGVQKHGNILCFVKVVCNCSDTCSCLRKHLAVIKPVPTTQYAAGSVVFNHIFKCDTSSQVDSFFNCDVVSVLDLKCVMFKLQDANSTFLVAPLNDYELE